MRVFVERYFHGKYNDDFVNEVKKYYKIFFQKFNDLPPISFHLFLLPIEDKSELVSDLDYKLKIWQSI